MIKIKIEGKDKLSIQFFGENFLEIVDVVKRYKLKYNDKEKNKSYGNKKQFFSLIQDLTEIEEVSYYPNKQSIDELIKPKLEVFNPRIRFLNKFLKSPPLGQFQIEGIKKLIQHSRFLLSDEMGNGKSYQTISALNHLWSYNKIDRLFIVTKNATLFHNWINELLRFSTFITNENEIAYIDKNNRNIFDACNQYKCLITDYGTFRLISDYYHKQAGRKSKKYLKTSIPVNNWKTENNRAIVLDECHLIKNQDSQTSQKLKMVKHFFEYRYGLSGTPAPNLINSDQKGANNKPKKVINITEFFSIFEFLDDNIINQKFDWFLSSNFDTGNKFQKWGKNSINFVYTKKYNEFMEKVKPFMLKRLKKDVLPNLPDLNIKKIIVRLSEKQLNIYTKVAEDIISKIFTNNSTIYYKEIKERFILINLICSDPKLLSDEYIYTKELSTLLNSWKFKENSKLPICNSLIDEHIKNTEEKMIIWSFHPYTINHLQEYYIKYNPIILHGGIKEYSRSKSKADYIKDFLYNFRNNKDVKLAILSPLILGTGINLEFCKYNIFFDRDWDVKNYVQALNRCHRATSTKDVFVYNLVLYKTIEVMLNEVLELKKSLNDSLKDQQHLTITQLCNIITGEDI